MFGRRSPLPGADVAAPGEAILLNHNLGRTWKLNSWNFRESLVRIPALANPKLRMLREVGVLNKGWPVLV